MPRVLATLEEARRRAKDSQVLDGFLPYGVGPRPLDDWKQISLMASWVFRRVVFLMMATYNYMHFAAGLFGVEDMITPTPAARALT